MNAREILARYRAQHPLWAQYWRNFSRMSNIGSVVFIPAPRPKWGVVISRVHDEITVVGDYYNRDEAVRVARRIRLIHVKKHGMTRRFRAKPVNP